MILAIFGPQGAHADRIPASGLGGGAILMALAASEAVVVEWSRCKQSNAALGRHPDKVSCCVYFSSSIAIAALVAKSLDDLPMEALEKQLRRSVIEWDARRSSDGGAEAQKLLTEHAATVGAQLDFVTVSKVLDREGMPGLLSSRPPFAALVTGASASASSAVGSYTFVVVATLTHFFLVDANPHSGPHSGMIKATIEAQLGIYFL